MMMIFFDHPAEAAPAGQCWPDPCNTIERRSVLKASTACYRMDRRKINLVKFILEGYDHMGGITTLDRHRGLVRVFMAPGCEQEVLALMEDLSGQIRMERTGSLPQEGVARENGQ
jgi:hypothetical protein